ncbi:hypothetical protein LTS18_008346 [Coniosporium uncinatum]|uniref:Uncharacterized protein n=1 Tax=Coniosporium uncinatum TaxID=93489 RepID=A0ACC3D1T2_9PEZI|nr:hypothetical protein LTS18_008346 [Coniosporium uncinatum]
MTANDRSTPPSPQVPIARGPSPSLAHETRWQNLIFAVLCAPVATAESNYERDVSDAESTTDLDLSRAASRNGPSIRGADMTSNLAGPSPMDTTMLSEVNEDTLINMRKTLEGERRAACRHQPPPVASEPQENDTIRSTASARTHMLPRKSSLKDVTGTPKPTDADADTTTRQDSDLSILSNVSRRRRAAQSEMTSAFILPDITVRVAHQNPTSSPESGNSSNPHHDAKSCTICHRIAGGEDVEIPIPVPVPMTERLEHKDDVDATMRPSAEPASQLHRIIKELGDEVEHLKMEKAVYDARLSAQDPALGARRRKDAVVRARWGIGCGKFIA